MSFIITARIIATECCSQILTRNFYSITQKILCDKSLLQATIPVFQKNWLSDKKKIGIKTNNNLVKIYSGKLTKQIRIIKIFSLSTSFSSLLLQPFVLPQIYENSGITSSFGMGLAFGIFAVVTPLILHKITNKYINDIYYNERTKTYIASTFTIFVRRRQIEFTPADVNKPTLTQMLTNCYIKGQPLLLDHSNFIDIYHYGIIMGYDKPMDIGSVCDDSFNNNQQCSVEVQRKKSLSN